MPTTDFFIPSIVHNFLFFALGLACGSLVPRIAAVRWWQAAIVAAGYAAIVVVGRDAEASITASYDVAVRTMSMVPVILIASRLSRWGAVARGRRVGAEDTRRLRTAPLALDAPVVGGSVPPELVRRRGILACGLCAPHLVGHLRRSGGRDRYRGGAPAVRMSCAVRVARLGCLAPRRH